MKEYGVRVFYPEKETREFNCNSELEARYVTRIVNRDGTPATAEVISRTVGEWRKVK